MAAKLKDGLFLGDFETAQDLEFIIANKITRVINCSGREIANAWERSGIRYLTFYWPEAGNCVIFDDSNSVLDDLYAFIEEALDVGDSVLIHSTDGQSRASFCACVYFMLKYKWTLPKTLEYLQNKRPDLMPRPGFMRQLQALDASLQRVLKAGAAKTGGGDIALRRYSQWQPELLPKTYLSNTIGDSLDDELLLVNSFLNGQSAPEEVIRAAQSDTPISRPSPGPLSHSQGSVHFSSAPSKAKRPGSAGITWIDDHTRRGTSHGDVPISPSTRRPTMERPPTSSYNSLAVGPGWTDSNTTSMNVILAGPTGSMSTKVVPTSTGSVSAAGATVPGTLATASPGKIKSILRGSSKWEGQQGAPPTSSGMTFTSGARRTPSPGPGAPLGRAKEAKVEDEDEDRKVAEEKAAIRNGGAAATSLRRDNSSTSISSSQGEQQPLRFSAGQQQLGNSRRLDPPLASASSNMRPPSPASTGRAATSTDYGSTITSGGMMFSNAPQPTRVPAGFATTMSGGQMPPSTTPQSIFAASLPRNAAVKPQMMMTSGLSGAGPVKPTAAALSATTRPGSATGPVSAGALSSLAQGNLSRTLASSGLLGSSISITGEGGLAASLRASPGATSTSAGMPHSSVARTSASRVRGYSPGPGKARERANAPKSTAPVPLSTTMSASSMGGRPSSASGSNPLLSNAPAMSSARGGYTDYSEAVPVGVPVGSFNTPQRGRSPVTTSSATARPSSASGQNGLSSGYGDIRTSAMPMGGTNGAGAVGGAVGSYRGTSPAPARSATTLGASQPSRPSSAGPPRDRTAPTGSYASGPTQPKPGSLAASLSYSGSAGQLPGTQFGAPTRTQAGAPASPFMQYSAVTTSSAAPLSSSMSGSLSARRAPSPMARQGSFSGPSTTLRR